MSIASFLGCLFVKICKPFSYCIREWQKTKFESCGRDVYIGQRCIFTAENISVGNDVYIGSNACMQSVHGRIIIGNHVMFGPGVHIHGGNHKIRELGHLLKHTPEKLAREDGEVVVEDDCWVGANTIILAGVRIGTGSVIGAGAVVTKDIPPYSIYTGIPDSKLRNRFTEEELREHLKLLEKSK